MRNVILGYLFTRTAFGDRAARAGVLVVAVLIGLLLFSIGTSTLDLFGRFFLRGVREGLRNWDRAEQTYRRPREVRPATNGAHTGGTNGLQQNERP
jgi:hypothetical protein